MARRMHLRATVGASWLPFLSRRLYVSVALFVVEGWRRKWTEEKRKRQEKKKKMLFRVVICLKDNANYALVTLFPNYCFLPRAISASRASICHIRSYNSCSCTHTFKIKWHFEFAAAYLGHFGSLGVSIRIGCPASYKVREKEKAPKKNTLTLLTAL